MLQKIFQLFKSDITTIPQEVNEDSIKKLVSYYSNGNVNLQQSKYITASMLKEKQKIIFSHKFI